MFEFEPSMTFQVFLEEHSLCRWSSAYSYHFHIDLMANERSKMAGIELSI